MGPHTHDDDALGYVQQYNDRGHPTSKETELHNKRLRRAQNEVLKLAGVAKSRHDEPKIDQWKDMNPESRENVVVEENEFMFFARPFNNLVLDLSTSWISNFRDRLMVSTPTVLLRVLII